MVDDTIFGEGSVETGEPISWVIFIVMVLIMIQWLTTPGITPLPAYAQGSPLLGSIFPTFQWLLIAMIPIATVLVIQEILHGNIAVEPSDRLQVIVYNVAQKAKAKRVSIRYQKGYKEEEPFKGE